MYVHNLCHGADQLALYRLLKFTIAFAVLVCRPGSSMASVNYYRTAGLPAKSGKAVYILV